jgi:hypothetical protein
MTRPADSDSAGGYSLRSAGAVVSDDLAAERRFKIPGLVHEHGARRVVRTAATAGRGRSFSAERDPAATSLAGAGDYR